MTRPRLSAAALAALARAMPLALAVTLAPLPPALAADPVPVEARAAAVADVIRDQIAAFRAGDLERAFAHASPMIQTIFHDPQNFGRMVETGYPMVWRPERYEIGALVEDAGGLRQIVTFLDRSGRWHEAEYEMRLIDGLWRINGVRMRELPGLSS